MQNSWNYNSINVFQVQRQKSVYPTMAIKTLAELSREQLAQLGREYMLAAQFNSRTGYAALRINHGDEAYLETAIDNWMAASPVYTQRMQRAMRLTEGSDIATILKGMQLECGLSHQYFDAGFEEVSEHEGRFWLNSCGALLETEPRGEAAVKTMCHSIEDPTFDATAVATNPRARVRPIHRPPRIEPHKEQHCKWQVVIDAQASPLQEPELTGTMRETLLAGLALPRPENAEPGGLDYYDGPVFETLRLEQFSHAALVVICKELAVQFHLLVNSLGLAITQRYGGEAAAAVAEFQMAGSCWVISERLVRWFGHSADEGEGKGGIDTVINVLQVHPALQPREYTGIEVTRLDDKSARITMNDCPALREDKSLGWYPLLQQHKVSGLEALLAGIDKRACLTWDSSSEQGGQLAWTVEINDAAALKEEPLAVQIAKGTVLYTTKLDNHIQLLELSE